MVFYGVYEIIFCNTVDFHKVHEIADVFAEFFAMQGFVVQY